MAISTSGQICQGGVVALILRPRASFGGLRPPESAAAETRDQYQGPQPSQAPQFIDAISSFSAISCLIWSFR